jgi:outer membrane lipoprotein-sorting protein
MLVFKIVLLDPKDGGSLFKSKFLILSLTLILAASAASLALAASPSLESVLSQLDSHAKEFHSLSADVERTKVTVVVNDHSTETGSILVHGEKMRLDLKSPDPRTILKTGDSLFIYNPKLNRVEEYNLGKYKDLADQYLLLGFGTPGHELKKGYLVTLAGESNREGKHVVELELTPKSESARNQISKIQLWIDESSWLTVEQKFFETGSDDYFTVQYTNIVRNPNISENEFKPHWPKGVDKVKPQG